MPGTQGQFGQERTASQLTNLVSGSSFRLDPDERNSRARSSSGNTAARGLIQNRSLSPPQNVSKDARPYGLSIPSAKVRPASYAAPSVLAETTGSISCVAVDQACVEALIPWKNSQWMERGVPLGIVCRRKVVTTDASNTGWGALCYGKPAFGLWTKAEAGIHINCLEMLAACRALHFFLPDLKGHHVLVRLDSMTVVSYINRQGGLSSKRLFTLKDLLEWAQLNLCSLRATHVPGRLNQGADMLSRSNVPSGEWTLHPQTVQKIWEVFGKAEVDLFASEDNSHCPICYSKDRDALAHDWPNLLLYAFPPTSLIPQVLKRVREQKHKLLLGAPLWRNQHWFSEL
ncbi:hypothetical protein M9458_019221, partial [Cirrhinus mrigala]